MAKRNQPGLCSLGVSQYGVMAISENNEIISNEIEEENEMKISIEIMAWRNGSVVKSENQPQSVTKRREIMAESMWQSIWQYQLYQSAYVNVYIK
jgi:hypothetical protein